MTFFIHGFEYIAGKYVNKMSDQDNLTEVNSFLEFIAKVSSYHPTCASFCESSLLRLNLLSIVPSY